MMGGYGGWSCGSALGAGFGFGWIFMIIIWALIIWAIIALVRHVTGCKGGSCWTMGGGDDSAKKILKDRYAKGEINKEEFEQKMKDMENMK